MKYYIYYSKISYHQSCEGISILSVHKIRFHEISNEVYFATKLQNAGSDDNEIE